MNPLRRSCVSKRSRCGAVRILLSLGEPSAEIVRDRAILLLWVPWVAWVQVPWVPWVPWYLGCPGCAGCPALGALGALGAWLQVPLGALWVREMACGSCLVVCAPAFAIPRSRVRFPLVRGSSGLKIAALKYKRSTRSVLLQLRLENRNF